MVESACRRTRSTSPACGGGRRARKSAAGGGRSILSTSAFCGSTPTPTLPREERERECTSIADPARPNLIKLEALAIDCRWHPRRRPIRFQTACSDVVARLDQAIQYSRDGSAYTRRHGLLDAPRGKRGMTGWEYDTAFPRRAERPSCCANHPRKTEGAGKAGCPPHPWSACNKKARGRTTGTGGSSGLPCAMVLRLIRALPGDRALLPPSPRETSFAQLSASVGAPGPHDFAVRFSCVRQRTAKASTASRFQRP